MDSRNGNGDGGTMMKQLPIGFRFHPTDEELLLHYLKRKICSLPLPANVIHDLDVFRFSPWDLPGDMKEKRYFFCKRQRNTVADYGYWKDTGKHKKITSPNNSLVVIGLKRSLVFYKTKHEKTRWMMQEFCLVGCVNYASSYSTQELMMQVGEWLVCRVYQKKTRTRVRAAEKDDELVLSSAAAQTSSPCSSGITEIDMSSSTEDQEATSHTAADSKDEIEMIRITL